MKVFENILDCRLKALFEINDNQFGIASGRFTTDAIYIMQQIQQKYVGKMKKLCNIFVDLKKAFD